MLNFRFKGKDSSKPELLAGHPVLEKFPAEAERISELIKNDTELAAICRDYAEIVSEITGLQGSSNALLLDHLIRLRSDLEADIAAKLGPG